MAQESWIERHLENEEAVGVLENKEKDSLFISSLGLDSSGDVDRV